MCTNPATVRYVQEHLDEDMEMMARLQPCPIEPSLPSGTAATTTTTTASAGAFLLLQVVHVEDVSLSLRERLQAVLPANTPITSLSWNKPGGTGAGGDAEDGPDSDDDDFALTEEPSGQVGGSGGGVALATLQASEAAEEARHRKQYGGSGAWRCLRLVLTDGFTRVIAVEDRRARPGAASVVAGRGPPVFPSGVTLGSKIKLVLEADGQPVTTRGILRLHSANTTSLGGEVRALQVLAEADARQRLESMTGRPSAAAATPVVAASPSVTQEAVHAASGQAPARAAHASQPALLPAAPVARAATPRQEAAPVPAAVVPSQGRLPLKPLEAWDAHVRDWAGHPFRTQAVITEVVSDMLLNEYPPDMASQLLPTTLAAVQSSAAWSATTGETITLYSLLIQLSSPAAVGVSQGSTQANAPPSASSSAGLTLIVDLGHPWLLELVGMPPRAFRALSEAAGRDAQQAARLQGLIERVGQVLETLGTATLVLQQRPLDQVVEVVAVEAASH